MSDHRRAARFDFDEERETGVYVCERVAAGAPILEVAHDPDGDWQFLCGGSHGEDDEDDGPKLSCLECVVADDPSLNEVADLCRWWSATRERAGGAWTRHDGMEDEIRHVVEHHGWFVMKVPGDDDEPGFAYTIGLQRSYGHPELITIGLRLEVMHRLLNACGDRIRAGERLPVDTPFAGIVDDHDVRLRHVRDPDSYAAHVGYAIWFNGGPGFPLLQLAWPDLEGRFPGEPGVHPMFASQQPLLP